MNGIAPTGTDVAHLARLHSVVCIQESKLRDKDHTAMIRFVLEASARRKVFVNGQNAESLTPGSSRRGGVLTIVDPNFPGFTSADELLEHRIEGRYSIVRVVVNEAVVYLHNIYAPTDTRVRATFFSSLPQEFTEDASHLVCGDFNLTLDPALDALRPTTDASQGECREWMGDLQLEDCWRVHHPTDYVFSGPTRANRIDYMLASSNLCRDQYERSDYLALDNGGDHLAVQLRLTSWHPPRGPGTWRVPRWLLEMDDVRAEVRTAAEELLDDLQAAHNPGVLWTAWKYRVRRYLQNRTKAHRREGHRVHDSLVQRLELLTTMHAADRSPATTIAWYNAKRDLDAFRAETEALRRTQRFDFLATEMERSSAAFFRKPATARSVTLDKVELPDGTISTDPAIIYDTFQQRWGSIFGDRRFVTNPDDLFIDPGAQEELVNVIDETLRPDQQAALDSPFTVDKFVASITSMRSDGAPGPDGLTARFFFQIAPNVFGAILALVFDAQFQRGKLLAHQNLSEIFLLHKKGSRANVGNFRPIALMQVEVIVLSRVLVQRLKPLMHLLIHEDQQGFVPGRSLHHHLLLLSDLQAYCRSTRQHGYAAFLDFEKAYDRVDLQYLLRIMERQGFGPRILHWIRLLYSNPMCSLMLDGWPQPRLFPSRGVKQGDPLSPYLFLLALEPLGVMLRRRAAEGLPLSMRRTATGLFFADDSLLLSASIDGIRNQLDVVRCCCAGSGARLNEKKSSLLALHGVPPNSTTSPLPVLAVSATVKYLGLHFSYHKTDADTERDLELKLTRALGMWQYRARTLARRKLVVATMVLSLLWYKALHTIIQPKTIKRWQRFIIDFVVAKKVPPHRDRLHRISTTLALTPSSEGGLGLPDISTFVTRHKLRLFQELALLAQSSTVANVPLWAVLPLWSAHAGEIAYSGRLDDVFYSSRCAHSSSNVSKWWSFMWTTWGKLSSRLCSPPISEPAHTRQLLHAPVWTSTIPALWVIPSLGIPAEPLASGLPSFVAFCRQIEFLGYRSTRDHLVAIDGDFTPGTFMTFMLGYAELRRFRDATRHLQRLFQRLSVLLRNLRLLGHGRVDYGHSTAASGRLVGVPGLTRFRFFPQLRKDDWTGLLRSGETQWPSRAVHLKCTSAKLASHSSSLFQTRRWVTPTIYDIQFRVLNDLLPVNARLFFLQRGHSDPTICPHRGCFHVESLEHCFWICSAVQQVWVFLRPLRALLLQRRHYSWHDILLGGPDILHTRWSNHQDIAFSLWLMLRGIFMRATWLNRNRTAFGRPALPARSVLPVSLLCLSPT